MLRPALGVALTAGVVGLSATAIGRSGAVRFARGAAAGLGAGVVAGLVMNAVHELWSFAEQRLASSESAPPAAGGKPSTVKAAEAAAGPIAPSRQAPAGNWVHFAMAAVTGAVYGGAITSVPLVSRGRGLAYGAIVWLVADEVSVPAFGLSQPPWRYPAKTHARALLAHLAYGATLDAVFRALDAVLPGKRRRFRWW